MQIGSSSMKILCDNSVPVEPAQESRAQERQPDGTWHQKAGFKHNGNQQTEASKYLQTSRQRRKVHIPNE